MSQRHSTLPEVVSTILPLIDSFPELRWSGLFTTEDFVEHWFPFIADLVQNGVYAPPITNSSDGGVGNQHRRRSGSNSIVGGLGGRRRSSRGTTAVKALVSLMRRTSAVPGDAGTVAATRGKRAKGVAHAQATALKAQSELMPSVVEAVRTFVSTCPVEVRHVRLQEVELGVLQRRISNDIAARQIPTNSRERSGSREAGLTSQLTAVTSETWSSTVRSQSPGTNQKRGALVNFLFSSSDEFKSTPVASPFAEKGGSLYAVSYAGGSSNGNAASGTPEEVPLLGSVFAQRRERLMNEIVRIMTTPRGRRAGFANAYYRTFEELRAFVEMFLSALFAAADTAEEDRVSWTGFESFLTDAAIAYNTQLALRDVSIFVEDDTASVRGTVTFADVLCQGQPDAEGRLCMVVQDGVALASLKILAPHTIHDHTRCTTVAAPSFHIKACELVDALSCFVCCSDRAIHFFDFRFGVPCTEIFTLGLEVLLDSPSALLFLAERNVFIVGGISGSFWKITPPQWSSAKREWKAPALSVCRRPEESGASGAARDAIHLIRRAYLPHLIFVAIKSHVLVYDLDSETVKLQHNAADGGIHHITGVVFNSVTQYLVCTGEALHLLVWLSSNLACQTPNKLEDLVAPHSGHIVCLESHPCAATVVTMDSHGAVKIWDLNATACSQNILVPIPRLLEKSRIALRFFLQKIVIVVGNKVLQFKVDDETIDASPGCILLHPKGGSFFFTANRDILEFSSGDAKKLLHHQNLTDMEIVDACFAGPSLIAVLNSIGAVSIHSTSNGKVVASYPRKLLKAEGVDIAYCTNFRRVVVPTASPAIWFLPLQEHDSATSASALAGKDAVTHQPLCVTLDPLDGAATCVSVGLCDKAPHYAVGTVENSVNIFALVPPPHFVRFRYRIPPPPTTTTTGGDDGGGLEPDQVSAISLTMRVLVVCDTGGRIRLYRSGRWTMQVCCSMARLILSNGKEIGTTTKSSESTLASSLSFSSPMRSSNNISSTSARDEFDVDEEIEAAELDEHRSRALCIESYKQDSVIVVGDTLGNVLFCDITKSLRLVYQWRAHATACNCIAVDKEIIVTAGDTAELKYWTSTGDYLGHVWGRHPNAPEHIPADIDLPLWLSSCTLIGEGSFRFAKKVRAMSIAAKVTSVAETFLQGKRKRQQQQQQEQQDQPLQSSAVSSPKPRQFLQAHLLRTGGGEDAAAQADCDAPLPLPRFDSVMDSIKSYTSTLTAETLHSRGGRGGEASVSPTASVVMGSARSLVVEGSPRFSCSPTRVGGRGAARQHGVVGDGEPKVSFLEASMERSILEADAGHAAVENNSNNDLSLPSPLDVDSLARVGPADPPTPESADAHSSMPAQTKQTTVGDPHHAEQHQHVVTAATHLRPIAWKAREVCALDDRFRSALGAQRVLHCVSQSLGQPDTISKSSGSLHVPHPNATPSAAMSPQPSGRNGGSYRTPSPQFPLHRIQLCRSGNVVDTPTPSKVQK